MLVHKVVGFAFNGQMGDSKLVANHTHSINDYDRIWPTHQINRLVTDQRIIDQNMQEIKKVQMELAERLNEYLGRVGMCSHYF